jgi:hypothetical protein
VTSFSRRYLFASPSASLSHLPSTASGGSPNGNSPLITRSPAPPISCVPFRLADVRAFDDHFCWMFQFDRRWLWGLIEKLFLAWLKTHISVQPTCASPPGIWHIEVQKTIISLPEKTPGFVKVPREWQLIQVTLGRHFDFFLPDDRWEIRKMGLPGGTVPVVVGEGQRAAVVE